MWSQIIYYKVDTNVYLQKLSTKSFYLRESYMAIWEAFRLYSSFKMRI